MNFLNNLFGKNKEVKVEKKDLITNSQNLVEEQEDPDEIAAVIAATIASMDEDETVAAITAAIACVLGKSTNEFVVRNIKRTSDIDSIWALKGRMNLMNNRRI